MRRNARYLLIAHVRRQINAGEVALPPFPPPPGIDKPAAREHFSIMESLLEIEEAIARLPVESRRQLVHDLPALCPDAFPPDGWAAILQDPTPRATFSSLLDTLDAGYPQNRANFLQLNDKSLESKP